MSGACDTPDVVTIRWDRPKTDGGAPILGYLVEHRRTGSPHWVRAYPNLVPTTELALSGLEPGWRYQFRITAENVVGKSDASEISDPLTVTLQRNAIAAPRFNAELCDATSVESDKIEFQVAVTGTPSPEINWFKDGFEIFSSRRTKILTENDTSTLVFHETALTDEGEIKCTATNRAGHAVTKANLRIEAPPKIRLPRNYEEGIIVEAEEAIKLKVGIAGRPTPVVCWTHNGEPITPDDRFEIETTDKNSSLRILHGRREDRGEYNARAVNKLGEDNGSVLVTVTARPSPPGPVTVAMSLGQSVTLSWNAPDDDGGCKIGNYTVEYFRIGWNMWLKATTTRSLTATLSDLIEGSEYMFRVKAENPYGMSEPSEESAVLFIPDPKRGILRPSDKKEPSPGLTEIPAAPRRRRMSPFSSSNYSLDESRSVTTAEKGEQTHMARLRIQKSTVNVQLIPEVFDSDTIARDMSYGSPDPPNSEKTQPKSQVNRERSPIPGRELLVSTTTVNTLMLQPQLSPMIRPRSVSPVIEATDHKIQVQAEKPPSPVRLLGSGSTLSPIDYPTIARESMQPIPKPSSSKCAILLDCITRTVIKRQNQFIPEDTPYDFEFDEDELTLPPPPLSISAPELSVMPPAVPLLKRSVSSTELLYEKAMARFYKAMELDEKEQRAKTKSAASSREHQLQTLGKRDSIGSSIDRGLERKSSLRRRLSGEIPPITINFSYLRSTSVESSVGARPPSPRKTLYPQESLDDPDYLSHVDDEYTDDYTESTASSGESETEKFKRRVREHGQRNRSSIPQSDLDTYHPRNRTASPYASPDSDQAVEVLTIPYSLPSPDFVPKPILKRPSSVEGDSDEKRKKVSKTKTQRKSFGKLFERKQSADDTAQSTKAPDESNIESNIKMEKESKPEVKPELKSEERRDSLATREKAKQLKMEMRQSSIEEEKVVISHYSDLVREKGNWRSAAVPLYLNADELKRAAGETVIDDDVDDYKYNPPMKDETPLLSPSTRVIKSSQAKAAIDPAQSPKLSAEVEVKEDLVEKGEFRGRPKEVRKIDLDGKVTSPISRPNGGSRNSSAVRRASKTPVEARVASKTRERSTSKSPLSANRRPLSVANGQRRILMESRRSPTPNLSRPMTPQEEIQQQQDIDIKVKSTMSYTTDLVLFVVACWVYLFKDARLALPIVLLLVYRHIKEHLPKWMVRKPN